MYKLIAFDMDGTLLDDNKILRNEVKKTLQILKKKGHLLSIATGRSYMGISNYLNDLGEGVVDFAICFNGAYVRDLNTNQSFYEAPLDKRDLHFIYQISQSMEVPVHFVSSNRIITPNNPIGKYTVHEAYLTNTQIEVVDENFNDHHRMCFKGLIGAEANELLKKISTIRSLANNQLELVRSGKTYLEILKPNVSKGSSLQRICQKYSFKMDEVLSIGDQENDMSMIELSGFGVAMGNGVSSLKKKANFVTKSNNEDGVIYALKYMDLI